MSEQRVSSRTLVEIEEALKEYENEVNATNLAKNSKDTYLSHANHFVRWLKGDFEPGERV